MSKTVDQRVVEMRFDNKQFESNVSTTMSTLGKLKQSLNLTGATKGLENVGAAAKGVNMLGLGTAVEAVHAKFSALQVMGVTALSNITNSAVNAGKRIVSALTIDPIKTGFSEYETQINAVQTILANTESKGTTLGQVNSALDTLNKYADKTIYNFTEMTRNIGTFTAAGVDLDTSVNAIQGIANLAAVSGSSSQQASTAMYQLSQALASGTVKLMDWNSVVNAGMGGQVFQDALKETARVHGVSIDAMIKKNGSFRETLQEGWLTSDILTETLSHFTMAAEEGSKQWETYKKSLMDDGYTEEQAKAILKLSNTATDAATKVKTATQLWDTLKETAQSGWSQTWETVFGDFGESKELFSGIYERLSPILEASAKARNDLLSGGLSSGWKQLMNQGIADEEGYIESVKTVAKDHGIAIDEMIKKEGSFDKALKAGLKDGSITSDMLSKSVTHLADKMRNMTDAEREAAGYTEEHIQQIEELEKGLKDGSISMDEFIEKMSKPSGRENIIEGLKNAFDGLLNVIKPVKDAFRDIFPPFTSEQLYGFTENFKALTVRFKEFGTKYADQIKRTFKGIFSIVDIGKKILTAFGKSLSDLIGSSGVKSVGEFILDTAASIGDFFTSINENFDVNGVSDIFSKMASGISSALGMSVNVLKGFGSALSTLGDFVVKVASKIWGGLKVAFTWISENFSVADIFAGLAGGGIFVLAKKLGKLVDGIKGAFDGLFGKGKENTEGIIEKFSNMLDGVHDALGAFTSGIKIGSIVAIAVAIGILSASLNTIAKLDVEDVSKGLFAIGALLAMLSGGFRSLTKTLTKFNSSGIVKAGFALILVASAIKILAGAMETMSQLSWEEIAKGLVGVGGGIVLLCGGLKSLNGTKVSLGTSIAMLALAEACKILGDAMEKFSGFSWDEIARGLTGMGGALAEMVISLSILSKVGGFGALLGGTGILIASQSLIDMAEALEVFAEMSWPEIGRGLAAMGGALGEVTIVTGALGSFAGFSSIFASGAILIVAQGLGDMANALKDFGSMQWDEIGRGLSAMGGALSEVSVVVGLLGGLAGFSSIFASGAILIVVQGLSDLASAFKRFGDMSWDTIGAGLVAMGGALGEVAAIVGLLGGLAGFSSIFASGAILIAVQGLSDLASALQKFGSMSWDEIGRGLVGMAGALTEVAVISGVLGTLAGLPALLGGGAILLSVQGLGKLADAFKKFGEMSWDEIGRGLSAMGGALGELALGSLINTLSGFGAAAISEAAEPLGLLADSVKKWSGVTVPENLSTNLTSLAAGVQAFTFGGFGAGTLAEAAPAVGTLADSIKKWSGVTVPENIGTNLDNMAAGIKAFTFGGFGASALAEAAPGIGTMADSVKKWTGVTVPENLGTTLQALGNGVQSFTFGGSGASSLAEAAPGVAAMADSVNKWAGVTVPETLGTSLSTLASGVKAFTFGGSGAGSLTEAAPGIGTLADSVKKWVGVTVPEGLVDQLGALATGIKKFTFGGSGSESIATSASGLGTMADSVKKWSGVTVPENLGDNLSALSSGVKSFTFGGSGADTLSTAATGVGTMADSVKKWSGVTIPEGFGENLKSLAAAIKEISGVGDVAAIASGIDSLASATSKLAGVGYSSISDGMSSLSSAITDLSGVSSSISGLGASISNEIVTPLKNASKDMSSTGADMIRSIATGLQSGRGSVTSAVSSVINAAVSSLNGQKGKFQSAGKDMASRIATGLNSGRSGASSAATSIASGVVSALRSNYSGANSAGAYLGDGFISGVNSKKGAAWSAGYTLGEFALQGIKDALRTASPSKEGIKIGKFLGEGVILGINSEDRSVYKAGESMGNEALSGLSKGIGNISSAIETGIDTRPAIRPIMDLSDVKTGVDAIGAMLGAGSSVGIMTNVGAISTMMSRRGQNGATDEVVDAINKLRRDLGNIGTTTYTIGDITYDDGSNVSNAVRALVREARLERRR